MMNTCAEVDELLERLVALVRTDLSPAQFHEQLLGGAVQYGAIGAAIWFSRQDVAERADAAGIAASAANRQPAAEHVALVQTVVDRGQARIATVEVPGDAALWPTTCEYASVIAPFFVEEPAAGAVELFLPTASSPREHDAALELATAIAEVVGDYYRRRQLAECRRRESNWRSLEQFIARIYRSDFSETAAAVVHEGRWFVGCDRVSLVCAKRRSCRVVAVSGIERVESRSSVVRRMQELAEVVLKSNEPLWHHGETAERPPQIEQALQAYVAESNARALIALPLEPNRGASDGAIRSADAVGVLVFEWFAGVSLDQITQERIEAVNRHAAAAVVNAIEIDRLPLVRVNRAIAKIRWLTEARQLPKTIWALSGLLALVCALVFVPADFAITAEGELQPVERRQVFAPADGVVAEVLVEHGDDVEAGRALVRLRSASLDFESAGLQGEIQTAGKRLAAIGTARLELAADKTAAATRYLQLTSEEEELKETLKSLRRQEVLLESERAELEVRSPLAGRVLSWDVARELTARPVERGQELLSVGHVAGHWQAELRVADDQIGYLLAAEEQAQRRGEALRVSFLLAGDPGTTYEGEVEKVSLRSQASNDEGEPFVLVTVRYDEQQIDGPRPGAGVVGKIDCGRRSLGFVWLHDAWNSIRRRVLF